MTKKWIFKRVKTRKINLLVILGVFAFLISMFLFWNASRNILLSVLSGSLFVLALIAGGRLRIWISLFTNRDTGEYQQMPNWTSASAFTIIIIFSLGVFTNYIPLESLMLLIAIQLCLVYALAKIRCWILGCCGSSILKVPIQIIESGVFFLFAIMLYYLKHEPRLGLVIFAFFYPFSRYFFHRIKKFRISYFFAITNLAIAILYSIIGLQSD